MFIEENDGGCVIEAEVFGPLPGGDSFSFRCEYGGLGEYVQLNRFQLCHGVKDGGVAKWASVKHVAGVTAGFLKEYS